MKVSVIIPVYNSEKYLVRCLDSIIKQSYSNIEIIMVDNGSKDNSTQIIKEYEGIDNRIKSYICNSKGASAARNFGLNKSTGRYGLFIDSDDYVSENYVKNMISKVYESKMMVLCNNEEIWKDSIDVRQLFLDINDKELSKEIVIKEIASGKAGLVCSKLFDLEIVRENSIQFDTNVKLSEDLLFFLEIAKYTEKFVHINESLYFYDRRNENSITRRYLENVWEDQIYVLNKIEEILSEINITDNDKEIILYEKLKKCITLSITNEIDNIAFNNITKRIRNIEKIINKDIKIKKDNRTTYSSFQEKLILSGFDCYSKSIWIIQMLFIFKICIPLKCKIKIIR